MTTLTLRDPAFLGGLGPPVLWTPAQLTTALWLDASDASTITTVSGAVSQWNDKNGNARNATQSTSSARPSVLSSALNGYQALQYTSNGKFLEVLSESAFRYTSTFYLFTVFQASKAGANVILNKGRNTYGSNGWYLEASTSASTVVGVTSNASVSTISSTYTTGSTAITSHEINGATCRARRNGTTDSTTVGFKPSWIAAANTTSLAIGQYNVSAGSNDFQGLIHQIIIMSSVPSFSIIQNLEGWAAHYYNLQGNLPADHPYKSAAPTV